MLAANQINLKGMNVTDDSEQLTFSIDENGRATLRGNIHMLGGSISWNYVTNKPSIPSDASDVGAISVNDPDQVFNTLTENGLRKGLFYDPVKKELYISADYIRSGILDATNITTKNLSADKIKMNGFPSNYAIIGGEFGDLILHKNGVEFFRIRNDLDGVSVIASQGGAALWTNGQTTKPYGEWDFSDCNPKNLNVPFVFE